MTIRYTDTISLIEINKSDDKIAWSIYKNSTNQSVRSLGLLEKNNLNVYRPLWINLDCFLEDVRLPINFLLVPIEMHGWEDTLSTLFFFELLKIRFDKNAKKHHLYNTTLKKIIFQLSNLC